jgi:hypothetical protein
MNMRSWKFLSELAQPKRIREKVLEKFLLLLALLVGQ